MRSHDIPEKDGVKAVPYGIYDIGANAVRERVIGSLRREVLDHILIPNETHLRTVLAEFAACALQCHAMPYPGHLAVSCDRA